MSEYHLFILWERARYQQEKILADIREHFAIVKLYDITWTPELVSSNFTRFYGENLPSHSDKEQECGTGAFLLMVVRDDKPKYEARVTSHGMEQVNVNMYDGKAKYRAWTGGGHKIHGSNTPKETNHNLTMLLGLNTEDFLKQTKADGEKIETLQRDITGAKGWKSVEELFYVLNNTVRYVIMRGVSDGEIGDYIDHTDTDILTDEYRNFWYIANGTPCRSIIRPKERVVIEGKIYDLDMWNTERDYYDQKWNAAMLGNRELKNGYYVLSAEDDFYCLLYHCLINKDAIAPDYKEKLERYKKQFGIKGDDWYQILVDYLERKSYVILRPDDTSNGFHLENQELKAYALKYGVLRKRLCEEVDGQLYLSAVYEKTDSFVKKGTPWLIDNETRFLRKLEQYEPFPHIMAEGQEGEEKWIEISRVPGVNMTQYFKKEYKHNTMANMRMFIEETLKVLIVLRDNAIVHRDITPDNLRVDAKNGVLKEGLIAYRWTVNKEEETGVVTPDTLGGYFASKPIRSDVYSFTKVLRKFWPHIQAAQRVSEQLKKGVALEEIKVQFTMRDYATFIVMRHKRLKKVLKEIIKRIK